MEDALKALLSQIYSAPSPAPPAATGNADRALSPDEFRMYIYKVIPCTRRGPHSWVECSFCHPGEKASRRDPQKYAYAPIACPAMRKEGRCARGDDCWFAHSIFEYWLHPARYRTQLCSYGVECKRSICFFAHDPRELRVTEHLAQLQELENELEAQDPAFAAPNAKWSNANQGSPPAGGKSGQAQQQQQQQQRPLGSSRSLNPDTLQAAQLRQLQQALGAQASSGLSHQAMLNAALGSFLPPQGSLPSMPHASAGAAAAALLEAALQPSTPPMAPPLGMSTSLSPCSSLITPLASLAPQHDDTSSVAATMKLLADITAAGHGSAASRLQHAASLPAVSAPPAAQQQQQQQAEPASDIQQALHLIAQLQQLAVKASSGNSDLQSVLLTMLPQVLAQASGPAAAAVAPAASSPLPGLLSPRISAPVAIQPLVRRSASGSGGGAAPPAPIAPPVKAPTPRDCSNNASPADVLSYRSQRTAGSSCSSRLSDGTHSPTLSHHSDEGLRTFSVAGFPSLTKDDSALMSPLLGLTGAAPARDLMAEQHGPFSLMAANLHAADAIAAAEALLPASLEHDADLASGMSDMSGAAGMIASLSQLVDSPVPSASVPDAAQQLQQLVIA